MLSSSESSSSSRESCRRQTFKHNWSGSKVELKLLVCLDLWALCCVSSCFGIDQKQSVFCNFGLFSLTLVYQKMWSLSLFFKPEQRVHFIWSLFKALWLLWVFSLINQDPLYWFLNFAASLTLAYFSASSLTSLGTSSCRPFVTGAGHRRRSLKTQRKKRRLNRETLTVSDPAQLQLERFVLHFVVNNVDSGNNSQESDYSSQHAPQHRDYSSLHLLRPSSIFITLNDARFLLEMINDCVLGQDT